MARFGKTSLERLATVDERLVKLCDDVIQVFDVIVLCGARTPQEQDRLFAAGASKLRGDDLRAKHIPRDKHGRYDPNLKSLAVDIAPWPIAWNDTEQFTFMAGLFLMAARKGGVHVRWGGNWDEDFVIIKDQTFNDLVHFEIVE